MNIPGLNDMRRDIDSNVNDILLRLDRLAAVLETISNTLKSIDNNTTRIDRRLM